MSLRLQQLVWRASIPKSSKMLLLALADRADDNGTRCFPSRADLAKRTMDSERTVTRRLADLESAGLIECVEYRNGGRNKSPSWRLNIPAIEQTLAPADLADYQEWLTRLKGDISTENLDRRRGKPGHSSVYPTTKNGHIEQGETNCPPLGEGEHRWGYVEDARYCAKCGTEERVDPVLIREEQE